jgi:hypothetical protein
MIVTSKPVRAGGRAVVWGLFATNRQPVSQPFVDPPTAAAFVIQRIDVLTEGETHVETGRSGHKAIRVQVENRSDEPAVFRMELELGPNYARMSRELALVVEAGWREAYDRAITAGKPS